MSEIEDQRKFHRRDHGCMASHERDCKFPNWKWVHERNPDPLCDCVLTKEVLSSFEKTYSRWRLVDRAEGKHCDHCTEKNINRTNPEWELLK